MGVLSLSTGFCFAAAWCRDGASFVFLRGGVCAIQKQVDQYAACSHIVCACTASDIALLMACWSFV